MVSGKCPHPWNKGKEGTFKIGHKQINKGHGYFKKGHKSLLKTSNKKIQTERYHSGNHPFAFINKIAQDNALKSKWYDIGKSNWIKLRKKIKEKDKWTCQKCGCDLNKRKSNCHHKIPYAVSKDNSEENLETLCIPCHAKKESDIRLKIPKNPKNKNI